MKDTENKLLPTESSQDSIDVEKLRAVFTRNLPWIFAILIICSTAAYLATRWTKDVFESESQLKLDIKREATELGIKNIAPIEDMDIISGEIEQIRSSIFLSRIIDSLNLRVSYFSQGNVLYNEMYQQSPFEVKLLLVRDFEDVPIYFFPKDEYTFRLELNDNEIAGRYGEVISLGNTKIAIINSKKITSKDPNEYYFVINSRGSLINYLSKNSSVDPLNISANTIRISFKDNNSKKAMDIVNKIDSLYIKYSYDQKSLTNKQKIDWLNNEIAHLENQMNNYEDYFENYILKNKSSDAASDLKRTIGMLNKYDSQRLILSKRIIEINNVLDSLVLDKKQTYQYPFLPAYINQRLEAYSLLKQQRDKLVLSYNENTFAFQQKEKDVLVLKEQIIGQFTALKENWIKSLADVNKERQKLEKEFLLMPDKNSEFSKNLRFYNMFTEFYLSMLQSKAQFEIAQAGTTPDFKILSSASMPRQPITKRKILYHGIGLAVSVTIIFFFIGFSYVLDNKVTSIREIDHVTSIPVLGIIPTTRSSFKNKGILVADKPKSMASEAVRSLRTNLDFFLSGENKKLITVSSSISGEGKSFLTLNLGGVLAMSNKKVILLDIDMRKNTKPDYGKEINGGIGMSTVLIHKNHWKECVVKTQIENLDVIPSGPLPPNPSELLVNGAFSDLLEELKKEYDFILMDTPPAGLVTDAIMAMRRSDLSIFVIRANYSKKDFVRNINRITSVNKLNNVAIVFNALPQSERLHGYGYYEEYHEKRKWWQFFKS